MTEFFSFLADLSPELQAVIVTAIISILAAMFRPSGKIKFGDMHRWSFTYRAAEEEPALICVSTHIVMNTGFAPAEDIDIIFSFNPDNYAIWPKRAFEENKNPNGDLVLSMKKLGRFESVGIECQRIGNETRIGSVIYGGKTAKQVMFWPQIVQHSWAIFLALALVAVGVFSIFYWLFSGLA